MTPFMLLIIWQSTTAQVLGIPHRDQTSCLTALYAHRAERPSSMLVCIPRLDAPYVN